MNCGIYILANDRVMDQAIALLNSIRLHDAETPIVLIPYDQQYHIVERELADFFGVTVYEDLELLNRLDQRVTEIFGDRFFARPNQFRKQACWFGNFDRFLYIDTDIVVFQKIIETLKYLDHYDFICCDYQHQGGIKNVFSSSILDANLFTETDLKDIFNCGFWGSKKGLFSEPDLYRIFTECAVHSEYFDFSQKTSDQPIINYLILNYIPQRFNLVRRPGGCPGSWAGSQFEQQGYQLIDPRVDQVLPYLHWAGFRIQPGCPYWAIWEHYRYLNQPELRDSGSTSDSTQVNFQDLPQDQFQQWLATARQWLRTARQWLRTARQWLRTAMRRG